MTKQIDTQQRLIDSAAHLGVKARIIAILANFATVPLVISTVTVAEFGVWSAITSLLSVLTFLDFGVGNGAMGRIAQSLSMKDDAAVIKLVRHTYAILVCVTITVITLLAILYFSGLAQQALDGTDSFLGEHAKLLFEFVLIYSFVIPASFVQRLLFAYQLAGHASVIQLAFWLLYFSFAVVARCFGWGLQTLVLGYATLLLFVYSLYTVVFLKKFSLWGRIIGDLKIPVLLSLLKDSSLFFALQLTVAIIYNSDQLILTSFISSENVAIYSVSYKLFSVVMMFNGLLLGPLWPAYSAAIAKGDWTWIRSAYLFNLKRAAALSISLCTFLIVFGPAIIYWWTNSKLSVPVGLLLLFGVWSLLEGYGQAMAMLLNAMRVMRLQLIVAISLLTIGTVTKIGLAHLWGIYGPLAATILSFVLIVAIIETWYIRKLFLGKNYE